ncbi:DUF3883 domain-containing protein [Sphingorhabdus arenilitoris]|uniref:DUF3883 domain-containing protein n=1 Tax=Sphingorhabdus arenilitoris TaxID=1490041 RepID=A0ABV8REK3_9SPHN
MGLLTGRLVRAQAGSVGVPLGWAAVIDGQLPLTTLGNYSYIVGRAWRDGETAELDAALDLLACSQILHVGFKANDRWFVTASLMATIKAQLELQLGKQLTDNELRYLSGAVINTLDSADRNLILQPYIDRSSVNELLFDFENKPNKKFNLQDIPEIVSNNEININEIAKAKAALFWAQAQRGIYSRAMRSAGFDVIAEFTKVDQKLAALGKPNLLTSIFEDIAESRANPGIFRVAAEQFSEHSDLITEWDNYEEQLLELVNKIAEQTDIENAPKIWKAIQKSLHNSNNAPEIEGDAMPPGETGDQVSPSDEMSSLDDETNSDLASIAAYIVEAFEELLEDQPEPSKQPQKAKAGSKVAKTDHAKKDAKNRKLGFQGEQFVVEYEKARLVRTGRDDLAQKVEWVSKEIGDGLGYDILSFQEDGTKFHIEVKTTNGGKATPFYISVNELEVWRDKVDNYCLYRVFRFAKGPKLFVISGDPIIALKLEPMTFRARV